MIGTQRLDIPGWEGRWVELRDEPTYGQMLAAKGAIDIVLALLVDWNLTDEHNGRLPIDRDSIEEHLPLSIWRWLTAQMDERIKERSAESEAPFVTPSTPGSPPNPATS